MKKNQQLYYITPNMFYNMGATHALMCRLVDKFGVGRKQRILLTPRNLQLLDDLLTSQIVEGMMVVTRNLVIQRLRRKGLYTRVMRFKREYTAALYFRNYAQQSQRFLEHIKMMHRYSKPVRARK